MLEVVAVDVRYWVIVTSVDCASYVCLRRPVEWELQGAHVVQQDAQRPYVSLILVRLLLINLWRYI